MVLVGFSLTPSKAFSTTGICAHLDAILPSTQYSHQRKVSHFCHKSVLNALQRIVFSIILLCFSRAECTTHCIEVFYGVSIQGFERSVSTGGIGVPRRIRQFSRNLHSQFSLEFLYKIGFYARYQILPESNYSHILQF